MLINYFLTALAGFLLTLVLINILKRISLQHKLLIQQNVPLVGGIAIALSFVTVVLISSVFYKSISKEIIGIVISSIVIFIFGLTDDYKELSVRQKFLGQIVACSILILFGVRTQIVNIGVALNILITFIWIIGITNAFNLLDVLDGVTGIISSIIGIAFLVISQFNNDINSLILVSSVIGGIFGFLIYNLPPAKIYLGNSGSHFLGFIFASIAILISYASPGREVALFSPLLILGLPILDTLYLILIRISKKKLPFEKTNDHLPLRLVILNNSKKKALLNMSYLCSFFCVAGVVVSRSSNPIGSFVIIIAGLVSIILVKIVSKVEIEKR